MPEKRYVALRHLTFGPRELEPGDQVPIEPRRSYDQMLRLGQIKEVSDATATPAGAPLHPGQQAVVVPVGALLTVLQPGDVAVFVSKDGSVHLVQLLGQEKPPEEALEGLGLTRPEATPLVAFQDAPDHAVFVPRRQLFSAAQGDFLKEMAERFTATIADLRREIGSALEAVSAAEPRSSDAGDAEGAEATAEGAPTHDATPAPPASQQDAERGPPAAQGTPLAFNFVAKGKLERAGVTTYEQVAARTADQLNAIEGITGEVAEKILAAYRTWAERQTQG